MATRGVSRRVRSASCNHGHLLLQQAPLVGDGAEVRVRVGLPCPEVVQARSQVLHLQVHGGHDVRLLFSVLAGVLQRVAERLCLLVELPIIALKLTQRVLQLRDLALQVARVGALLLQGGLQVRDLGKGRVALSLHLGGLHVKGAHHLVKVSLLLVAARDLQAGSLQLLRQRAAPGLFLLKLREEGLQAGDPHVLPRDGLVRAGLLPALLVQLPL
mmetsp:Transcript_17019/g.45032  ORF Transcript_17019/g.45032 Transcript_17019/m.45032 type:complete len:215 (+) Transcript_17019:622-1266(+)